MSEKYTNSIDLSDGMTLKIPAVPEGGRPGQVLQKNSENDYDVGWVDPADYVLSRGMGIQVGHITQCVYIDESKGLQRYLNGQVIVQTEFPAFTNWVNTGIQLYPSLGCTEEEWQTIASSSAFGQCGKFVVDNEAGTIRLPFVVNAQGLADLANLGNTVAAGLPNITGSFRAERSNLSGAFYHAGGAFVISGGTGVATGDLYFNASRSSSIYGNSDTVQPEAVQYPWCIQVAVDNSAQQSDLDTIMFTTAPYYLEADKVYTGVISTDTWTIVPPYTGYTSKEFHQTLIQVTCMQPVTTIDFGTTSYFNAEKPVLNQKGSYNIIYEYDPSTTRWFVGAVYKGTSVLDALESLMFTLNKDSSIAYGKYCTLESGTQSVSLVNTASIEVAQGDPISVTMSGTKLFDIVATGSNVITYTHLESAMAFKFYLTLVINNPGTLSKDDVSIGYTMDGTSYTVDPNAITEADGTIRCNITQINEVGNCKVSISAEGYMPVSVDLTPANTGTGSEAPNIYGEMITSLLKKIGA